MEMLFAKQDRLLNLTSTKIVRDIVNNIHWDARLIAIRGARGVGKTTLMLQYIKMNYPLYSREVLYCTMDSVFFTNHSLLDLADDFYKNGGKRLFLDEIHKYPTWSKEVKEIYDMYPDMHIVISGSSLLKILNGDSDLSRRCIPYTMQGLSFREYMIFYEGIDLPVYTLENILKTPEKLCAEVNAKCRPLQFFKEYLQFGYYPFYLVNQLDYYTTIEQVSNFIIETELTQCCGVDVNNTRKIKALLGILASSVPFEVDISKLATMIGVHRNTVISYLYDMDRAKLLNLLFADLLSVKKMQKPDKIYLENTNMVYALAPQNVNIGTVRETFVVNQLSYTHRVEYGKKNGDFNVDGKYLFEVGGEKKTYKQIADLPDSFILADDLETPYRQKLPLWCVGFLY
jgi:predicted AAA+ superfamily ATPase